MDYNQKCLQNIRHNKLKAQFIHDVGALLFGSMAGILQLEAWFGFGLFVVSCIGTNLLFWLICAQGKARLYFESPINDIFVQGILRSFFGYLMMWCLVFALIDA